MSRENVKIIFRNHQWMVQNDKGTVFLVQIMPGHPDDLEGGYSISGSLLAHATRDGHSELFHICEKNWVDVDALEPAARQAIALSGVKPNYDIDEAFVIARQIHAACA